MIRKAGAGLALIALMAGGAAQAEVLRMFGEFAAPAREASLLRSISVDPIQGPDGPMLEGALENALIGAPFALMVGGADGNEPEGSLHGVVDTRVQHSDYRRRDKRCAEKDARGKCVREEEVQRRCTTRIVTVTANLRIVRLRDNAIVYSRAIPFTDDISWCEGDRPYRSVEESVAMGLTAIPLTVRRDIIPDRRNYQVRVRESTKGMAKPLAARFTALVRLTKTDAAGACAGWSAMRFEAGGHPSVLFNNALCAEQAGRWDEAIALYRQSAQAGAGEGNEGADRAARLIAGAEDAQVRARW